MSLRLVQFPQATSTRPSQRRYRTARNLSQTAADDLSPRPPLPAGQLAGQAVASALRGVSWGKNLSIAVARISMHD